MIDEHPIDEGLDIPAVIPSKIKRHEVRDAFEYDTAFRFGFIGLGQGGSRIAETFYNIGYRRVGVINSAIEDLRDISDDIQKLDFGTGGAGQDMIRGKEFLADRKDSVWDLLLQAVSDDPDYLMVCVSLGGGTGTGGAPQLIELCRHYMRDKGLIGQRVGVIMSLPAAYEGQRTCRNAVQGFKELYDLQPSPMVIIDNKKIEEIHAPISSTDLFPRCNNDVARLFHLFNRLATQRSNLITFDRADYATLLDSGIIAFGASTIPEYEHKAQITSAIRDQLTKTVLAEVDLRKGRAAGCVFLGGPEVMSTIPMEYFGEGFEQLSRIMATDSVVFRGVYVGTGDDLRCYTMLSGLEAPISRLRELASKSGTTVPPMKTAVHLGVDDSEPIPG